MKRRAHCAGADRISETNHIFRFNRGRNEIVDAAILDMNGGETKGWLLGAVLEGPFTCSSGIYKRTRGSLSFVI